MRAVQRIRDDEHGQAAVIVAGMFLALVLAVAVVVNVSQLLNVRRQLQTAADAAAVAAAASYSRNVNAAASATAALDAAELNGQVDATRGGPATVDVHRPPSSGPHLSDTFFVEVLVSRSVRLLILSELGPWTLTARAVAGQPSGGTGVSAFAGGTGNINRSLNITNGFLTLANGCDNGGSPPARTTCPAPPPSPTPGPTPNYWPGSAQVNSSSTAPPGNNPAAYNSCPGGGHVGPSGAVLNVVGNSCGSWPGPVNSGVAAEPDPYHSYPLPVPQIPDTTNWCRKNNWNSGLGACTTYPGNFSSCSDFTDRPGFLKPGLYTGRVGGTCDWILEPGVYVFRGSNTGSSFGINNPGGLTVEQVRNGTGLADAPDLSCGGAGQAACGVLLFFTQKDYPSAPSDPTCPKFATFSLSGGNEYALTPEPNGLWSDFLIIYDYEPACAGQPISFGGNTNINLATAKGIIYTPTAIFSMGGTGTSAILSQVVMLQINVSTGNLVVDVGTMSRIPRGTPRLVE